MYLTHTATGRLGISSHHHHSKSRHPSNMGILATMRPSTHKLVPEIRWNVHNPTANWWVPNLHVLIRSCWSKLLAFISAPWLKFPRRHGARNYMTIISWRGAWTRKIIGVWFLFDARRRWNPQPSFVSWRETHQISWDMGSNDWDTGNFLTGKTRSHQQQFRLIKYISQVLHGFRSNRKEEKCHQ